MMKKLLACCLVASLLFAFGCSTGPKVNKNEITSWTYVGIAKETNAANIKTRQIKEVVSDWKGVEGADMVNLPLFKGKEWGHASDGKHSDNMYRYYVKDVKEKDLSYIKGVCKGMRKVYTIRYATLGDHEEADYAEGIGIIRYEYVHHGTVDEKHLKLVEVKR